VHTHLNPAPTEVKKGIKRTHCEIEEENFSQSFNNLFKLISKGSPSSIAIPAEFRKLVGPNKFIGCNRPFEPETIPVNLLDEAFGVFMSKYEKSPSTKALSFLDELSVASCKWYPSETYRREAVQRIINQHTSLEFSPQVVVVDGREYTTDGNLTVDVMPACIRECKDSHGSAAILYYARFLYNALMDPNVSTGVVPRQKYLSVCINLFVDKINLFL